MRRSVVYVAVILWGCCWLIVALGIGLSVGVAGPATFSLAAGLILATVGMTLLLWEAHVERPADEPQSVRALIADPATLDVRVAGRIEEPVGRLAHLFEEGRRGAAFGALEPELRDVLADFWWDGVEEGVRLRDNDPALRAALASEGATATPGWIDRIADGVKNILLDLGARAPSSGSQAAPPLPAAETVAFLESARPHVDETIARLTEWLGTAATAPAVEACKPQAAALFARLGEALVDLHLRQRLASSAPAWRRLRRSRHKPLSWQKVEENWVEKYRRMKALEGD
jgi:hypothetical protein